MIPTLAACCGVGICSLYLVGSARMSRALHRRISPNDAWLRGRGHTRMCNQKGDRDAYDIFSVAICALTAASAGSASAQEIDWKKVDEALGRTAAVSGDVHRYGFPRTDLQVTLDGVTIRPALALGGWVGVQAGARRRDGDGRSRAARDRDQSGHGQADRRTASRSPPSTITSCAAVPLTFYMHVGGHGDPVKMATAIRDALGGEQDAAGAAGRRRARRRRSISTPPSSTRSSASRARPMAASINSLCRAAIRSPRTECSSTPAGPMGVATAINFQPTGGGKAAITGDFVLTGDEVNPVIKALRANGIEVTAVHSHMLTEQPRLFFMHFWANDDAVKLAKGLRAALDKTASAKS